MIKENSMMTDKEKQEWADLQKELAETQAELEKLREESEAIDQEFADAIEQLKAIREEDDDNWLMGINPNPPSGDAVSGEQYRLPDDYPLPREILQQHFPRTAKQCNFSGGWGYDVDHAVIVKEFDPEINPDEKFDGVSLEYAFIDKRIREELIFNRPEGERFEELEYNTLHQELHRINDVPYDYILVEVTAYPEKEWNELKADYETHNYYKDDPEGRKRNLDRKEACKITYQSEYYFNISDFMS